LVALRKFIARNSLAVGFGTAAVTAIVAIAAIAVLQAREARLESERATATRDFILGLFENANPELHGGRDVTARELLLAHSETSFNALDTQPEIHAEVLRAVADAWGRLGDYDRMIDAAKKRTRLLRDINDFSLYARALIEEAQIEAGRGNLQRVQSITANVDSVDTAYLTRGDRADLLWLKGWSNLSLEKYQDANQYFDWSLSASPENDFARFARAKFGLMKACFGQSKRAEAITMYKSALADANNKTLSPGERLRRSFEIVAALYEIGEYQSGWPGISGIFLNFFEIYGENARFNSPIALYWSNWAIKVGEINQVEKFISEYREKNPGFDPALQELVLFDWQLVELRMFLAKKDYSRLEKYLRSIDREVISLDQKMSLDLLEAESFLMKEIPVEALKVISSERWVDRISADDPMASNWFVYRYWIEGVALNEIGESRRAHEVLSLAEAASVKKFGENHPNTLKILLAKTYAGLRLKGDSGPPVEINEREVQRAVEMLRLKFPINSRAVSEAVELSRMVTDGSGRGASGGVGYLVQGAPFL
jgi:tetratricopeptide (TPR) repeat protein